jgi:ferredoxin
MIGKAGGSGRWRLEIDATACRGHGICALKSPDHVALDRWGFAHLEPVTIGDGADRRKAERAVGACPTGALRLEPLPPVPPRHTTTADTRTTQLSHGAAD